nr:putative reverse transcriptase domain-containing protein [Tanacetum cinerariifolium]
RAEGIYPGTLPLDRVGVLGSDDGVTTSFQWSRNSRPPMLDHQDKYMMKAQVHVSKSSAISDIQALPRRKHYCQIYQMINFTSGIKCVAAALETQKATMAEADNSIREVLVAKRGKLNPRYTGPFKILKRIGPVAYKLELPEELSNFHNTFYVSNLKKCISDESLIIPIKELKLDDKLNFVEEPVEIMDREIKKLQQSRIPIIKVRWTSKRGPEYTWEREDEIRAKYPHMFPNNSLSSS